MKKQILVCLLIVLLSGLSVTFAASPNLAPTDEELIGVGIVTYGLALLYEGMNDWGFMVFPGLSGGRSEDGSFSYTFKDVDPDGDGLFILNGTHKATVAQSVVTGTLHMTIQDSGSLSYTIDITAVGPPDDDMDITFLKINGKSFDQAQVEALFGDEDVTLW